MTRSHPPALIRIVRRTLTEECGLAKGERILLGVSGGSDSSALLHVLSLLAEGVGFSLVAHGVDHGLRPEAAAELDVAEGLASRCGVPFARTRVRVAPGGNVQARAREARREALERAARVAGATRIATAHHLNDRAETVLIRLLAGAGPDALGVLPPRDGPWIRPLIRAEKSDVLSHIRRHRIPFAADPSNTSRRFLRVRVRAELLPLMQELSPKIVQHLGRFADEAGIARRQPPLVDESGQEIRLKRAHAEALRRALLLARPARIRLPGDREIHVDPERGRLHVAPAGPLQRRTASTAREAPRRRRPPRNEGDDQGGDEGADDGAKDGASVKLRESSEKGGAKRGKSG